MSKVVVIVLDGFGIGYMDDVYKVRPLDIGANTFGHILENNKSLRLKALEKLGIMNLMGYESDNMKYSEDAVVGKINLMHYGADTYFGHQEIMGSIPLKPINEPLKSIIVDLEKILLQKEYKVEKYYSGEDYILIINDGIVIADNIDTDLGQAYNVTTILDEIKFEEALEVGKITRKYAKASRVIVFGGKDVKLKDLKDNTLSKGNGYIGLDTPKTGVYKNGYRCIHLGYGVDYSKQVQTILTDRGIQSVLIGKVADIVTNINGKSITMVDTKEIMKRTISEFKDLDNGFICTNIQETDISGHCESVERYSEILEIADKYIGELMNLISRDDLLMVIADHGNDPTIGHSKHTREQVPLLIYNKTAKNINIGERKTLSDVGATVSDFFNGDKTENGQSFLDLLKG